MQIPTVLSLEEQAYLSALLTQPHRHYHNITHINDCLVELYKMLQANVANVYEPELTYAIWYHDAIYNPYALTGVNEEQSAQLYTDYQVHYGKSSKFIHDEVAYAIRATAFHINTQQFEDAKSEQEIDIATFMLDIDLSGLGKYKPIVAFNSLNIAKEYPQTHPIDFIQGRFKFFTALNKRESFYYTDYFKSLYDERAKANVAYELRVLQDAIDNNNPAIYFDEMRECAEELTVW